MDKYYWLNEDARLTLERGYLSEGETPEGRIKDIADKAEEILGIEGFSNKFEDYMSKGFYSLSSPVWANFGKDRGFSISCVTGDTWVNTNKGGKKAKDIEVGDLVLTHKNRFKPVTKVMPTKDRDDIWKLKVGSRMTNLYITGDHVVLTNTGWKRVDELDFNKDLIAVNGELEYQEQKYVIDMKKYTPYDFEVEDGLIKARVVNKEDRKEAAKENYFHSSYAQIPEYVEVDEELAWAIGVWFADGSLSKNNKKEPNGIRMTCDLNKKETIVKEWSRIISDKFNINCNTYESNTDKSSWLSTNASSSLVGKFFESFGNGSKEKQLNEELLNLPKKELNSLLKGIFQDGTHYEETDNYKLTLSNPELLLQVYNIGLKLGKEMSLQMQEKGGKLSSTRHVYTVLFRGYTNSVSRNNVKSGVKFSDGLTYCPINVLERTEKVEDVYDFTVEEDHSFSVAGVVVHNCFGSYLPDSVAEILDVNSEVGMMSKLGGGTSGYFGDIRPRGAAIACNGESSGAVHFMQMFDKTTDTISQGGVRRGKFTPYLPIDHGDIHEFLEIGTEGNPIQDMTYAVTVKDSWMEDMINGDKEKREVWAKVLTRRTQLGYPYIFFENNANDNTVDVYKDKNLRINHSNLCVAPYTRILTSKGYQTIESLVGQKVDVWNGEEWSETTVMRTGENQDMMRVKTSSGNELDSTLYHKYYVLEDTASGKRTKPPRYKEVEAKDLKVGDKLIKFDLPVIQGGKTLEFAYDNGFFTGDGTVGGGNDIIYLYHEKSLLKDNLKSVSKWHESSSLERLTGYAEGLQSKYFVPTNEYSIESRLQWLSGYLDADGTVTSNNGSQSLQAASINREFLVEVQLMLQTLGVDSKVTMNREAGTTMLPANDGTGEYKEFETKEIHRILINGNSLHKLDELGLECNRLEWTTKKPNRECSHFITVAGIELLEEKMDTYCFNEPKRHMGMFNGILTGQCSEIMLPNNEEWSFVCNLSSMNLERYDDWKDTDAVETITYFLDAVMSEFLADLERMRDSSERERRLSFRHMERAYNFAKANRALGLGALGWHSYLQSKMIAFESVEADKINAEIFSTIQKRSYKASEELAKMFGEPEVLKGYGRRNTTTCAVAPTTSSSFILGQVSKSIEPFMSNYFVVDTAKVKKTMINPHLVTLLKEKGKYTDELIKDIRDNDGSVQHLDFLTYKEKEVFKTYGEINQYNVLEQAATRQQFIDQSQSLNLMVNPTEITAEELNELHLFAWANNIKSLYYMHGTNAAQQFNLSKLCINCEA